MRDVVKCPFCLEWVRSVEMPADARVQCPLCGAQVAAETLLQLDLPQLRVVAASAVEEPAAQPVPGFWDDEPAEIQQQSEDREPSESVSPAPLRQVLEVFEPVEMPEGARVPSPFVGVPQVESPSVARSWKSRRRGQRPWLELVKIVLGGLAGIVIAQLILWWLPGTLRRDPLGPGTSTAQLAPVALPCRLRGRSSGTGPHRTSLGRVPGPPQSVCRRIGRCRGAAPSAGPPACR